MKKEIIFKYFLLLTTVFLFNSCEDSADLPDTENLDWQIQTRLSITPVVDKGTFIWYNDLLTNEEYWGNENVELNIKLESQLLPDSFSNVEFYLSMEEKDGYNYTEPFNTEGKLVQSTTIPESGEFSISISALDAYGLFLNDLQFDRTTTLAKDGDIFLLYYVITANDGSKLDSRDNLTYERYGMKVLVQDFAPPVWEGTFNFEWIVCSPGAINWGDVYVGKTGSVNITHLGGGVYYMDNLLWDYYYGGPGNLYFDFLSGLTYVEGNYSETWHISNINGPSMDIEFWYTYSDAYDETGTVRFTRTDGADWPTNIYTE